MERGRLAPTPSGHLHLGNALAFGAAWLSVRAVQGELLLRIEDLDRGRSRSEIADAQRRDLEWLGLYWDREVLAQSTRRYSTAELPTYLCDCSRKWRLAGLCSHRGASAESGAVRLRSGRKMIHFEDLAQGPQAFVPDQDAMLVRRDGEPGYPLAVVLDDHLDGVTQVVRGGDLLEPTAVQVELYQLLGWTQPSWLHVPLLLGPDGRKLSKSHGSTEIRALREAGVSRREIWMALLPLLGCLGEDLAQVEFVAGRVQGGAVAAPHFGST
ncbi:MAG: glutamyl-Q tRNA(Asp) synthetase [Cognaticolwellia sp.]